MLPTHCGFCSGGGIYTCPVMFSGTASTVASSSLTGSTSMPWLFIYSQLLVIYSWDGLPTSLLLPVVDFFPNWRSYVCGPKSCDLFQIDNKIMIFLGKNDKLEKTLRPRKINREKRKKSISESGFCLIREVTFFSFDCEIVCKEKPSSHVWYRKMQLLFLYQIDPSQQFFLPILVQSKSTLYSSFSLTFDEQSMFCCFVSKLTYWGLKRKNRIKILAKKQTHSSKKFNTGKLFRPSR